MPPAAKALVSWSSGKDSAWALHMAQRDAEVEVVGLLTTLNEEFGRVSMQGVRRELVEAQARGLGLPLWAIDLPWPCPNEIYEERMAAAVEAAASQGITRVVFGDLFLEDVRDYRVERMAGTGVSPMFPIWGSDTHRLARQMIADGVRAVVTAVDTTQLDGAFAGRHFDEVFLEELPSGVDPLGENGEFHTFCHAGPMFGEPIGCVVGEVVDRGRFVYADVVPA